MPRPKTKTTPPDFAAINARDLRELVLFVEPGPGFRFGLATYDVPDTRDRVSTALHAEAQRRGLRLVTLDFSHAPREPSLLARIHQRLQAEASLEGTAVMVVNLDFRAWGPEAAQRLDLVRDANVQRDAFRERCPAPLVLWLNQTATTAFAREAPDLWHWRAATFEFRGHSLERRGRVTTSLRTSGATMSKLCVFISSTCEDLRPYRSAARDAALRAGFFPVMMEYWAAQANEPLDVCLRRVDETELLVLIAAQRYGWTPKDQPKSRARKSITWLECERAIAGGKDVLAFLLDDQHAWPAELREEYRATELLLKGQLKTKQTQEIQRDIKALAKFKTWLCTGRVIAKFTTPEDLGTKIESAVRQWAAEHPERLPAPAVRDEPPRDRPQDYLRWLYERTCSIDIRGLQVGSGQGSRFPIDELYIPLTTLSQSRLGLRPDPVGDPVGTESQPTRIELDEALQSPRLAIIGDPGAGKSTFLRRIAFLLTRSLLGQDPPDAPAPLGLADRPFPWLIGVASLAEHVRNCLGKAGAPPTAESPAWLAHYVSHSGREQGWTLSEPFLRRQLETGAALVLLDGLDEAASDRDRRRVATIVERAAEAYRRCRLVLTSRPAAYRDGLPGFSQVCIEPLEDPAIDGFLHRWCHALFADSPSQATAHCQGLLDALHSRPEIRRLARNPVMLTALAVVHWHEKQLPEQRADLYESILGWLARSRENRPERPSAERCVALLQKLALAMQDHSDGRQIQVARHWAARQIADDFREVPEADRVEAAQRFLVQEELDSGIVVGRGDELRFWHLTFQEYLAARAIAARPGDVHDEALFRQAKLHADAWRETVLLLAGVLYHQGIDRVDAMFAAVLDALGDAPTLEAQARAVGLLGAALADLAPVKYTPRDPRYGRTLQAVIGIFRPDSTVPIDQAIAAAEALGLAGDPRLAGRHRAENWVTIPAGPFWMGAQKDDSAQPNYDPEAWGGKAPVHQVQLSAYRIGRYPVTVTEYREFIEHDGYEKEEFWRAGGFGQLSEPDGWKDQLLHPNRPVVGVSWFEAAAYAAWAKARLPTEAEWERAARGGDGRKFPWGQENPDPTRMNYATGDPTDWQSWKPNVGHPTPVGVYPRGLSPEGLADMAGNVWQWCADWFGDYAADAVENPSGSPKGEGRVVRGGGWGGLPRLCRVSCRDDYDPANRNGYLGFRVVCGGVGGQD